VRLRATHGAPRIEMQIDIGFGNADEARATQWRAYLDRNNLPGAPRDLAQAGERIQAFLAPVWIALAAGDKCSSTWPPGGPWGTAS
jgi:hypothetical protein